MRYTILAAAGAILAVAAVAGAAPDWSTYEFPFSESDAIGDGLLAPAPPGGDIGTLSLTTEDGLLYLHLTLGDTTGASGDTMYQILMDVGGTVYQPGAEILWLAGEPIVVLTNGYSEDGEIVGSATWDATTGAIVVEVTPEEIGTPAPGAPIQTFQLFTGPRVVGGPGCSNCYDVFEATGVYSFGEGSPSGPAPEQPTPDVPVVWNDLTEEKAVARVAHTVTASTDYRFNWTTDATEFRIKYGGQFEGEQVEFTVTDGAGDRVLTGTQFATFEDEDEYAGAPGNWTIRIVATEMQGRFEISIEPLAPGTTSTSTSTSSPTSTSTSTNAPTVTTGPTTTGTTTDDPDEDSPGVGAVLALTLLVVAVAAVRRRL